MNVRLSIVGAALAMLLSACRSTGPSAAAEPPTPPPPPTHPSTADPAGAEPSEPATQPLRPLADGGAALYELDDDARTRCPLALAGVSVSAEEVPNGMSLVFRTTGDDDETERVREAARRFFDDLQDAEQPDAPRASDVRAKLSYSDAPGGAVVVFVPDDLEDLDELRDRVRSEHRAMQETRGCPVRPPAGIELARR